MTDKDPMRAWVSGPHITDHDREVAMWFTAETGRPVILTVRPRWWQFWKPGWKQRKK